MRRARLAAFCLWFEMAKNREPVECGASAQAPALAVSILAIAVLAVAIFAIAVLAIAILATALGAVPRQGHGGVELFRLKVSRSGLGHAGK